MLQSKTKKQLLLVARSIPNLLYYQPSYKQKIVSSKKYFLPIKNIPQPQRKHESLRKESRMNQMQPKVEGRFL